jgi:hypothetical protein
MLAHSPIEAGAWREVKGAGTGKLHLQLESARIQSMDEIFQKIVNNNFSDLTGLTVDASIPVPQDLINEIITAALHGSKNIEYCQAAVRRQNRVSVKLKTTLWPWPLDLKIRLFKSVDLTGSPKIRAFLENNVLLGKIGSFLNALPDGVKLYGDQVVVDIGAYLQTPEQARILKLIRSMEIKTEEGKAIFDVKIRVDK